MNDEERKEQRKNLLYEREELEKEIHDVKTKLSTIGSSMVTLGGHMRLNPAQVTAGRGEISVDFGSQSTKWSFEVFDMNKIAALLNQLHDREKRLSEVADGLSR